MYPYKRLSLIFLLCVVSTSVIANEMILVPGGEYQLGSHQKERSWAYQNSPDIVGQQQWYDAWESSPQAIMLSPFLLDKYPVTQREYEIYIAKFDYASPYISPQEYQSQGFLVYSYDAVRQYLWDNQNAPKNRLDHPVVLVSKTDAENYCAAQGKRLPHEHEWEAACRGMSQRTFPWGEQWLGDAAQHNKTGTGAVSAHPLGKTPDGIYDLIGNVFEWTSTPYGTNKTSLKGCSWDDAPGTCRCAFRHGRPSKSRHILIGFRCAKDY